MYSFCVMVAAMVALVHPIDTYLEPMVAVPGRNYMYSSDANERSIRALNIFIFFNFHCKGCGIRNALTSRIQSGRLTEIEEMPWMVAITGDHPIVGRILYCSGFIVSAYNVLTSARCVRPMYVQMFDE